MKSNCELKYFKNQFSYKKFKKYYLKAIVFLDLLY